MTKKTEIPVWDLGVRIFHWLLVGLFIASYLTGEVEGMWHIYLGYAVLALVVFRVLWGFIGNKYARFSNFIYPMKDIRAYLEGFRQKSPKHYLGHNPAGGLMVVLLLINLFLVSITGILTDLTESSEHQAHVSISLVSEAYADDDDDEHESEELWEEVHEFFVNLMLWLVAIHIAGIILSSRLHQENLVRAMITGKKKIDH